MSRLPGAGTAMVKVCGLSHGWHLYRFGGTCTPLFVNQDGRMRNAYYEMAETVPEAPAVWVALKKKLNEADRNWRLPGQHADWNAMDTAVLVLRLALTRLEKWSGDYLDMLDEGAA